MLGRTNTGGGGGGLNFQVVGGTTAPGNPRENTIWINTANKITSWIFSATEPNSMEDGMVWISVGTASSVAFSTTKKNPIMVYPISAMQYIGGEWESVEAKTNQSGEWVEWATFLFANGNQYVDLTGGWKTVCNSGIRATVGQTIDFTIVKTESRDAAAFTKNKVNLTDFKTLEFEVDVITAGYVNVGITASNTAYIPTLTAKQTITATGKHIATVDLTSISGKHYVTVHCDAAAAKVFRIGLR